VRENHTWEEARPAKAIENKDLASDEEIIELEEEQWNIVTHYQKVARQNHAKVLNDDQVVDICIEQDFVPEKIDAYLERFNAPKKYEDLEQFNWQETQSREQKEKAKKDRQKEIEQQRQQRKY